MNAEPNVAPLHEVFRLQGDDELEAAEKRYLPARAATLSAIVLAAGAGADFGGLNATVPKAMLKVQGRPILARLLDDFAHFGCRDALVVRGYHADAIDIAGARFVDNADYATTGEAASLARAADELTGSTLIAFGDIVVKRHILQQLLEEATSGITIAVDSALAGADAPDRVIGDRADTGRFTFEGVSVVGIGDTVPPGDSHGVWIGLMHAGTDGAAWLQEALDAARADHTLTRANLADILMRIRAVGHPIRMVYNRGGWANVNNLADLVGAFEI